MGSRAFVLSVLVGCGGNVTNGDAGAEASTDAPAAAASWSTSCLGRTNTYGSCDEYCASTGKTCSATCTTSRGYPNLAAEAWFAGQACSGNGSGQQTCAFPWDDDAGGPVRWRCCCR